MKKFALLLSVFLIVGCGVNVSTDTDKKTDEQTSPSTQVSETSKITYTNDTYGFSLELPESWKDYMVIEGKVMITEEETDNTIPVFYFNLKGPQGPEGLMVVGVYTKDQWAGVTEEEDPITYNTKIGKNDQYVFIGQGSQDNSEELITKRQEVESILKTFKAY